MRSAVGSQQSVVSSQQSAVGSQQSAYPVRLSVFEGPLDLLLHLIRTHKLDISEISITQVADQYLAYLALMESLDLEVAGEFLVMAATLMEIKSRLLLPRPERPRDEDEGRDPRAELVARLLEYERFQHVAEQLRELAVESGKSFVRPVAEQWEGAIPLVELKPRDLVEALRRLAKAEEAAGEGPSVTLRVRRQAVNLRQRMDEILRRIVAHAGLLPFSALVTRAGERVSRAEVLIAFLAILELIRLELVTAWQQGSCGEIFIQPREAPLQGDVRTF